MKEIKDLKEYAGKLWGEPTIHDPGEVISKLLTMIDKIPDQFQPPGIKEEQLKFLLKKYDTFISNISWHINTNRPPEEEIKKLNSQIDYYSEMITDLKALSTPSIDAVEDDAVNILRLYFDLMKKAETGQHFDHLLQEHDWNNKAKKCIEETGKPITDSIRVQQAKEAHRYKEALERIANPIKYLQELADLEGAKLDGVQAIALAKDGAYLSDIARQTLEQLKQQQP